MKFVAKLISLHVLIMLNCSGAAMAQLSPENGAAVLMGGVVFERSRTELIKHEWTTN
ncbi:MAG: hypothetical protein U5K38_17140 [Woeseiaceae bacterium]|nr:hypothetical protein [Woeseiaceae bacterium]